MKRMKLLFLAILSLSLNCYSQGWERMIGGSGGETANDVIQTADGGYLICGTTWTYGAGSCDVYLVKTNSAGDVLWTGAYGTADCERGNAVLQASDGGYLVSGYINSPGAHHA